MLPLYAFPIGQGKHADIPTNHFQITKFLGRARLRGAATFRYGSGRRHSHPATCLRALGPEPWFAAYVQPSRRPKDGRYGDNPNRLQHYYQFQVPSNPHLRISKSCISIPSKNWVFRRWSTTSALWKTIGKIPPSALGVWAGKCGSTAWK
jgi:hypothetical protein